MSIAYIKKITISNLQTLDALASDTEYIFIGRLYDIEQEDLKKRNIQSLNLPPCIKKIIIIDYDKAILHWSGHKDLYDFFEFITGHKIPFGCEVITINDEMDYEQSSFFFSALPNKKIEKHRINLFEINRHIEKGKYNTITYGEGLNEIIDDYEYIVQIKNKFYIKMFA